MKWIFLLTLLFLLTVRSGIAATYLLFDSPGRRAPLYETYLNGLVPGDLVKFSNGAEFQVREILGRGATTLVLGIGDGKVLRIHVGGGDVSDFDLAATLSGAREMKNSAAPIPKIYEDLSDPAEYLVVEKVNVEFTLDELIGKSRRLPFLRDITALMEKYGEKLLYDKLIDFAIALQDFSSIQDLRTPQVAWDGERWILLDWGLRIKRRTWYARGFSFEKMTDFRYFSESFKTAVHTALTENELRRCNDLLKIIPSAL